jgi:hypothetical protein
MFTANRGHGYPAPYNGFDFTNEYLGAAEGNWTGYRGLGYPAPVNAFDFTNAPTDPGGDIVEKSSDIDAGVSITIQPLDGFDVVHSIYGPVFGPSSGFIFGFAAAAALTGAQGQTAAGAIQGIPPVHVEAAPVGAEARSAAGRSQGREFKLRARRCIVVYVDVGECI